MSKIKYYWKGNCYFIDLYKDNTGVEFTKFEQINKTSPLLFSSELKDKKGVRLD